MKKLFYIIIAVVQITGCASTKSRSWNVIDLSGIYKRQESSEKLELRPDGTYTLFRPEILFTPVIEYCKIASQGRWSFVADNVIEITSDNYLKRQRGYEYEMIKETKFSSDSLYINIVLPTDLSIRSLDPLSFSFYFNNGKTFRTDNTQIVLPKAEYLWGNCRNFISFRINVNVTERERYMSRISFNIFEEDIDTNEYNYLTIKLPFFDRCFIEFEPRYQDLILINNKNRLQWRGKFWTKE